LPIHLNHTDAEMRVAQRRIGQNRIDSRRELCVFLLRRGRPGTLRSMLSLGRSTNCAQKRGLRKNYG